MNYFFVYQNKSYYEENAGGYLWAPQRNKAGHRVSHWEKMRSVKQGDVIIHSYHQQIRAISIAQTDAYVAERPSELSAEWQAEGWRVDTEYKPFEQYILTSDYKDELLRMQPTKDAPLNCRGTGNTGYLYEANQEMFDFILEKTASIQKNKSEKKRVLTIIRNIYRDKMEASKIKNEMETEEAEAKTFSPEKLVEHAGKRKHKPHQRVDKIVYYRNPYLKELVKYFAEGRCQMCQKDAPFLDKDHKPYLEEHHIKRLADGGSDTIDNVVAICPNCHRKVHILEDEKLIIILKNIAEENKKRYENLLSNSGIKNE